MTVTAFDTHASVKTLTAAGMSEAQAEAVTAVIRSAQDIDLSSLATKTDLADTKAEILLTTKADLAETKADILKWMIGMIAGAVVVNAVTVVGAMLALIRVIGR